MHDCCILGNVENPRFACPVKKHYVHLTVYKIGILTTHKRSIYNLKLEFKIMAIVSCSTIFLLDLGEAKIGRWASQPWWQALPAACCGRSRLKRNSPSHSQSLNGLIVLWTADLPAPSHQEMPHHKRLAGLLQ